MRLEAVILAGVALLSGCQPEPPPEIWRVASIGGVPFAADTSFGIAPRDGVYAGQGPCNRFSGRVRTDPFPAVVLTPPVATRIACPALAEETRLFEALGRVERMGVSSAQMTLTTGDGVEIVLTRR